MLELKLPRNGAFSIVMNEMVIVNPSKRNEEIFIIIYTVLNVYDRSSLLAQVVSPVRSKERERGDLGNGIMS